MNPMFDITVFNETRVAMGGKFSRLVDLFLSDTARRLDCIEAALSPTPLFDLIVLGAHSITASSAHMGAVALAELARNMEDTARENKCVDYAQHLKNMRIALAQVEQEMLTLISQ